MRLATLIIIVVIVLLQWPMWLGKGSWATVLQLQEQLEHQRSANQKLSARNQSLSAEVTNLKTGFDAVEERARSELGMIRQDEVFFQVLKPGAVARATEAASMPVAIPVPASLAAATPVASAATASAAPAAP